MDKEMELELDPNFLLDPSLALYLPLWKKDGGIIVSDDAKGHSCTNYGATWGIQGRYFITDDYILVPNSTPLQIDPAITYEFWVNQTTLKNRGTFISNNVDSSYYFDFYSNTGNLGWDFMPQFGADYRNSGTYAAGMLADTWYHIVVTQVRTTIGTLTFYINGIQVATDTTVGNPDTIALTTQFELGRRSIGSEYLNGYIGEFRIYNRALALAEINQNYLGTKWRY